MKLFDNTAFTRYKKVLSTHIAFHLRKGQLYKAIKVVASDYKKDPDEFLKKHSITKDNSFETDREVLLQAGFPEDLLATKSKIGSWDLPHSNAEDILILTASFIVSLINSSPEYDAPENNKTVSRLKGKAYNKNNNIPTYLRDSPANNYKNFGLGLVLKGINLGEIKPGEYLSSEKVLDLVQKSSYFLCTSQKHMKEKIQELVFHEETVDRDSEQHVFTSINFTHDGFPDEKGNRMEMSNIIQLVRFIRSCGNSFEVIMVRTLAKKIGLGKLGFIRS